MDIHTIDLEFHQIKEAIASYLISTSAGFVLIETGPDSTRPRLVQKLASLGIKPTDIKHVFVTHIHFDHAGATGWWAQQGAQIYVHHVGAPHLIDPSRLIQSATRIYGDQMDTLWGQIIPIPAEKVTSVHDNDVFEIGELRMEAWNTPGHAWHHHTYVVGDIAFTGDVAGVRLPHSQWLSVPAPPPEFKLEVWLNSLDRLESAEFKHIYPTHFGLIDDVADHLARLRTEIQVSAEMIRDELITGIDRDTLVEKYIAWNRQRARDAEVSDSEFASYEAANPLYMSVDGIVRYWQKKWEKEGL
jgi:glyoxylase-like metal-dependent hydrolase (beta-lactamase superfamily II)